jgi:hypothetical protein
MDEEQNIPEEQPGNERQQPTDHDDPGMPAGKIDPAQETLEQNQSSVMEAHHPHQIHHKKRWKDYLFEFFMLFLAVSSGFFAENQREHYVEHERAGEYAAMLRTDLASDTFIMDIIVKFRTEQEKKYDTLRALIDSLPFNKIDKQQFLRLADAFGEYRHLIPNNTTLQQLKSSGSLRYFKNRSIIIDLSSYEEDLKHKEYFQDEETQHYTVRVIPFMVAHFNFRLNDTALHKGGLQNFPKEPLVDFDKKAMMEFYYLLNKSAWYNKEMGKSNFAEHKIKAAAIIKLLEKEYPDK